MPRSILRDWLLLGPGLTWLALFLVVPCGIVFVFDDQGAILIYTSGQSHHDVVQKFNPYALPARPEIRFPTRSQGGETRCLDFSITSVEVLNQSPQKSFATD